MGPPVSAAGYADALITITAAATTVAQSTGTIRTSMRFRMGSALVFRTDGIMRFRQRTKEAAAATGLCHPRTAARSTAPSRLRAVSTAMR